MSKQCTNSFIYVYYKKEKTSREEYTDGKYVLSISITKKIICELNTLVQSVSDVWLFSGLHCNVMESKRTNLDQTSNQHFDT